MDDSETIKKLLHLVEGNKDDIHDFQIFDQREVATIKRMIASYEGWESVGRLGRSFRSFLMLIGFFVLAFATVKGWRCWWRNS